MLDIVKTVQEFPLKFRILVLASFIDVIGWSATFPFFSLYVTQKFDVGMTYAGVLLAIFAVMGLVGSMAGGALADKLGRRKVMLFGLVSSALSSLALGFVNDLGTLYLVAAFAGLFSNIGGPARQAMVADMLPVQQRAEGFGLMRVIGNLGWMIGPAIGGFLAARSYLALFVLDAVVSMITAAIVYHTIPETRPEPSHTQPRETLLGTLSGYRLVLGDRIYMAFLFFSVLMGIVYRQDYSTLSVFMRDVRGIPPQGYGTLISLNAVLVVLFQFWISRKVKRYAPMTMMALGTGFFLVGFVMYGFIYAYALFAVATMLIAIGEMIVVPVGQALAAQFAPEDMRGRYMALYSTSWTLPSAIGPWAAGLIMDHYDPNWVWYAAGILSAAAIAGFLLLHLATRPRSVRDTEEKQPQLSPADI